MFSQIHLDFILFSIIKISKLLLWYPQIIFKGSILGHFKALDLGPFVQLKKIEGEALCPYSVCILGANTQCIEGKDRQKYKTFFFKIDNFNRFVHNAQELF